MNGNAAVALYWKSWRQFLNGIVSLRYQSRFKIAFVCSFAAACEIGLFVLFADGFRFLDKFEAMGGIIVGRLFSLFFLGIGMMLVVSGLVTSYATMFRSEEIPFLMTRPFSVSQIVVYKFLETAFFASWAFFFIILPYVGSFARHEGLSLVFAVWTVLFSVPYLILCAGIGAILVMLLVRWVPRGRVRRLLLVGGTAIFVVWLWAESREVYDPEASIRFNLARMVPGMLLASNILIPSSWAAEGILSLTRGAWGRGAMLFGALVSSALFVFMLVEWIGSRLLYEGWQKTLAGAGTQVRGSRFYRILESLLRVCGPDVRALIVKDVKTFFRDPVQWSQAVVFLGLLGLYFANLRTFDYRILGMDWVNMMQFLNVFSVSAVMCSLGARFIYPQLSLEGQGFWILGLSPTTMRRILLTKFFTALVCMLTVGVVLMVLSSVMLKTKLPVRITALCLGTAVSFAVCGLSIGLGAVFLDLKQRNPAAIVSGFGGTLNLVLSLGFMLAVILPFGLLFHLDAASRLAQRDLWMGLVLSGVWVFILTLIATVVPLVLGIRSMKARDY